MPIRLNLLAEAQAAEEMRRRDPVKRAAWVAALLICLVLVWSSSLQLKAMLAKNQLSRVEASINARTNEYQQVLGNQKELADVKHKLAALTQLTTNRFLNGNLLNALQQVTVDHVQLVRMRAQQTYTLIEETKARTNNNRLVPGKPATVTERIIVTLDGNDTSPNPGDQVNQYKEAVAAHPYFQTVLEKTNSVTLKQFTLQSSPEAGKANVLFSLECRYPEVTR